MGRKQKKRKSTEENFVKMIFFVTDKEKDREKILSDRLALEMNKMQNV